MALRLRMLSLPRPYLQGILGSRALGQLPYFAPAVNSDAVGITSKISRFPTDAKIPDKGVLQNKCINISSE